MRALARFAIIAAGAFLLSGCLVSDAPMFDATNAAARPLAPGDYDACSSSDVDGEAECEPMAIELGDDSQYLFLIEDDLIEARFHSIGGDDYAVQLDDGDGFQYYWARMRDNSATLVMIWCEDLPAALVDGLILAGALDADADRETCTAKTPGAVIAAAKAYASGEARSEGFVRLAPAPPK